MKKYLVLIPLLILACNPPSSTDSAEDFSLVYENDIDRIDFDANTITRKYVDSVRTIKFAITKENRKQLLDFVMDHDVMNIDASQQRSNCDMYVMPVTSFKLHIKIDTEHTKSFEWNSNACGDGTDMLNQLTLLIMDQIQDQITPEKLPPTNIILE